LADLLTELRAALTKLQKDYDDTIPYTLTAAVSAGPTQHKYSKIKQMDAALDYWNLMVLD